MGLAHRPLARLNEELVRYLSPWFYDAARAAKGGRYVAEAEIQAFIETRPRCCGTSRCWYDPPTEDLQWYLLTPARQHVITAAAIGADRERGDLRGREFVE